MQRNVVGFEAVGDQIVSTLHVQMVYLETMCGVVCPRGVFSYSYENCSSCGFFYKPVQKYRNVKC